MVEAEVVIAALEEVIGGGSVRELRYSYPYQNEEVVVV